MGFVTLLLIAALLCAESPNGSVRDRYLIAQTITYRSQSADLLPLSVITQRGQYQGLSLIDWQGYKVYRQFEMRENLIIVLSALNEVNQVRVSNFCEVGAYCSWQSSCELIESTESHRFYLCPYYE